VAESIGLWMLSDDRLLKIRCRASQSGAALREISPKRAMNVFCGYDTAIERSKGLLRIIKRIDGFRAQAYEGCFVTDLTRSLYPRVAR
jgi:hypothetical protein